MSNIKLPKGWKLTKVSSIAELLRGINYTKDVASNIATKENLPILRGNNISGELNFEDLVYVPKSLIKDTHLIKKDDIIFAMSSGSKHLVGKSAVARKEFNGSFGAFCGLLRVSNEVDKKYVSYIFKGNTYRKLISEIAKGTNINNLKREHILDFEFPLPPRSTQQIIVTKIEELFSELDKGIENLRLAQQQLKTYRQSVLQWAFEGKLTSSNRNVPRNGLEPLSMAAEEQAEYGSKLPKGWRIAKFGELMESVRNGYSKKPDDNGTFRILRISSVRPNTIDLSDYRFLNKPLSNDELVRENDLLFTRYNGSRDFVGVCARVPKLKEKLYYPDKLIRCRPKIKDSYHSTYLQYAANSVGRKYVLSKLKTSAGQTGIAGGEIKEIPLPLPPLEEQRQIVEAIESRLSVADKMEESINQSMQQAEALMQSILKKAFEGNLT